MSKFALANNVLSTVETAIDALDTTIYVHAATSPFRNFPQPAFYKTHGTATIVDSLTNPTVIEIIHYTAIDDSGDPLVLTVQRGMEGTEAADWPVDSPIFQAVTAESFGFPYLNSLVGGDPGGALVTDGIIVGGESVDDFYGAGFAVGRVADTRIGVLQLISFDTEGPDIGLSLPLVVVGRTTDTVDPGGGDPLALGFNTVEFREDATDGTLFMTFHGEQHSKTGVSAEVLVENARVSLPVPLIVDRNLIGGTHGSKVNTQVDGGATETVNWLTGGGHQQLNLSENVTLVFVPPTSDLDAPAAVYHLTLLVKTHASSGATDVPTWPANVRWPGTAPTINSGNNRLHIVRLQYVQALNLYFAEHVGDYSAT